MRQSKVSSLNQRAFARCDNFAAADLSATSLVEIDYFAFSDNPALETVIFPDTIEIIGESAFANTTALLEVTIPESVTEIGAGAFYGKTLYMVEGSYADERIGAYESSGCVKEYL